MLIHEEMFLCEACSDMSEFHVTKKINKHTFTDYDRDLFYKHLTGYDFAAAGTSRRKRERDNSAVPVHFRNIKHIKNPLLKVRYVWEVVFPGKQIMIEKYSIKQARLFWLWYPYRYYCGLRGLVKVVNGPAAAGCRNTP